MTIPENAIERQYDYSPEFRTETVKLVTEQTRMCARMDTPKAVMAAAHKLARLIYAILTKGEEYTDLGQNYFELCYRANHLQPGPLRHLSVVRIYLPHSAGN